MTGLEFPNISPVALAVGNFAVRWYSLAYLIGICVGWWIIVKMAEKYKIGLSKKNIDDLVFDMTLGIVIGGRLGYVLFYGTKAFWQNPWEVFAVWHGGMSFHGGFLGVMLAIYLFAKKIKFSFLKITDLVCLVAPIGLFCGRIANFINDELWGRVTNVPWAIRFPNGGFLPRHPSQLYEALLEGVLTFIILNVLWRYKKVRDNSGLISCLFVILYGVFRIFLEQFREPDKQLGFFFGSVTMGQMLSVPLILLGVAVMLRPYWLRSK